MLSQASQVLTLDFRDSRIYPHTGYIVEVGTDYRRPRWRCPVSSAATSTRPTTSRWNACWATPTGASSSAAAPATWICCHGGREEIIDRFFLGGDNLRGFQTGGAGPHDTVSGDPLGWPVHLDRDQQNCAFRCRYRPDLGLNGTRVHRRRLADRCIIQEVSAACQTSANGVGLPA